MNNVPCKMCGVDLPKYSTAHWEVTVQFCLPIHFLRILISSIQYTAFAPTLI